MAKDEKSDYGTPELAARRATKIQRSGVNGNVLRVRVIDEDVIDTLLLKGVISVDQYNVIERLKNDLLRAGWLSPRAQNLEPRVGGGDAQDVHERTAFARVRVNKVIQYLDRVTGIYVRVLMVRVCMDEHLPRGGDEEEMIRTGINSLSHFYEKGPP